MINPRSSVSEYAPSATNKSALGDSTTSAANKAKTPYGEIIIIKSINFNIILLNESKKFFTGFDFSSGINIMPIPKKRAKNIT